MDQINENFDWDRLGKNTGGNRLIQNDKIKGQDQNTKCYSFEPYAQELFNLLTGSDHKIIRKDLEIGDIVTITDIHTGTDNVVMIELEGGLIVDVDLNREKRLAQIFGYENIDDFYSAMINPTNKQNFIKDGFTALVLGIDPIKISLWQGYVLRTRSYFMKEIDNPTKAFTAKVIEANKGGYFVEVQGVEAFMPGSLAAANKISDFMGMIGKEIIVMIEDYIPEMNSFIVSHKKYIEYVLPTKIKELDTEKRYIGTVTGTSRYGIFIEFEDIFTGLLHTSKMKSFTLEEFKDRKYKAGDQISFYINEVTKDNRIILTEEGPQERRDKITKFVEGNKEKEIEAKVAAIMNFGIIVNYDDISGLVPNNEFRKRKIPTNSFTNGSAIKVIFGELKDGKIVFQLAKDQLI